MVLLWGKDFDEVWTLKEQVGKVFSLDKLWKDICV